MPPRPPIPADDLYARLEIPVDAGADVIEVAWRALLRLHHPDVAGDVGLERSKRINVAHDWLSDPDLRARYDHARGLRRSVRDTAGHGVRDAPGTDRPTPPIRPLRRRPPDPAEELARFLDRVAVLQPDEIDRLACADPTPIAFGATIARFLPADQLAALASMETAIDARLDPQAAALPGVRNAVEAFGTELVLGDFLDELLSEPFRERARERLTRGWEAAVGQPRYGPNGASVRALLERLARLDPAGVATLAASTRKAGLDGATEEPWPPGTSPEDDEALRVSSVLAARDAAAAVGAATAGAALDPVVLERARRAAGRLAHLVVLRHAFAPATFSALTRPWRPLFLPDDRPAPRVRPRPSRA
ncbi:MAG: J domain-containing protein [Chloroflexota bacterium]